jgi:hypothetical protein
MNRFGLWNGRGLLLAGVALALFGCADGKKVNVEGQIVKNGQALSLGEGETLNLTFTGAENKQYPATVRNDGTFVARHLPPGKYHLAVRLDTGANDPAGLKKSAQANKEFESANAKLEYEVTDDSGQQITIDAGKGTATSH